MAEQVQAVLDSMVAPLKDLLERKVFSQEEITAIVARRRESEYLLRRRTARKADYLLYLQQEMQLERLRDLRTTQTNNKDSIGDVHIVQHIHFIFTRCLRKYKSDVSIYLEYIDFCKATCSLKTLSKLYAQALQFHPRNVGLWIAAASHEFFQQNSVANARVLLQRGIRVNPSSSELWLQYMTLELHHVQKLKGRREILQLQEEETDQEDSLRIAQVVYDNAIQALAENDVVFRLQCLDQCHLFPSTQTLQTHIIETMARDLQHNVPAWMARAAFACHNHNHTTTNQTNPDDGFLVTETQEQQEDDKPHDAKRQKLNDTNNSTSTNPVVQVLQEAVEACPTAEMYLASIQFLQSQENDNDDDEYSLLIHKLLIQAKDQEISSPALTSLEADILVHEGKLEAALYTLQQACQMCKDKDDANVPLWLQWARLCHDYPNKTNETPSDVLQMALKQTPLLSNGKEQMMILLQLFGALVQKATDTTSSSSESELEHLLQRILLLSPGTKTAPFVDDKDECSPAFGIRTVADACFAHLQFCISSSSRGIHAARKVYNLVLFRSNYGGSGEHKTVEELETIKEFVDACIQLELKTNDNNNKKKKKQRLGRLYHAAIELLDASHPSLADSYRSQRDTNVRFA